MTDGMNRVRSIKEYQGFYANRDGGTTHPSGQFFPLGEKDFQALDKLIRSNVGKEEDPLAIMSVSYKKRLGEVIQAKNFVGVISLPSGLQIEILPKIDISNDQDDKQLRKVFLKMLSAVLDLDYKTFQAADLDKASRLPLFEIFISDYCRKVRNVLRLGIKHDYAIQEDNLSTFRGKLRVGEQIRRNVVHKERFCVAHDDFGLNAVENRVIKTALELLRNKTKSSRNKIDISQLLDSMDDVPTCNDVKTDIQSVLTKRIEAYYRSALKWSILFLRGYSISAFSGIEGSEATALLFPMEKLFERYVAKELRIAARVVGGSVNVKTQERSKYLFESLMKYTGENMGPSFQLKPDIVLRTGINDILIADTKWKDLCFRDKNLGSSQGDAYQMSAYHRKYSREGNLKEIMLLYPKISEMPSTVNELGAFVDGDFIVKVVAYDLLNSRDSANYILGRILETT